MNPSSPPPFRHERLRVYHLALSFLSTSHTLRHRLPRGMGEVGSQFVRAALSVPLNIAEGVGREGGNVVRHLEVARGSLAECSAVVDVLRELGVVGEGEYEELRERLSEIAGMLGGLRKRYRRCGG